MNATIIIIGLVGLAVLAYALYRQVRRIQVMQGQVAELQKQLNLTGAESRQSKALFSTIATVAYDLVFVLDEESTIIAVNKSATSLFGDRNPIGEKLHDVLNTPDLADIVQRAISEDESLEEQFMIDGCYYKARTQVMLYDESHYFIGVAMQDVTQLVQLNRARRDMVANISHELSTPIANIRLIIEGLFHEHSKPKRKDSIASLHAIARETESLQWTVQELLDLSMIESGQTILKLVEEPLRPIVDEAIERLDEKLESKALTVVCHVPAEIHTFCDREHLRRVFMNVINNAIKWSPEGDTITVRATNGGEEITISVVDNGPGVPDDQRERIFERFYQVDTARSGHQGSGLGLAICKHIVEAHGGNIWAEENSQAAGGHFRFTLLNAAAGDNDETVIGQGQHDDTVMAAAKLADTERDSDIDGVTAPDEGKFGQPETET